MSVDVLFSNVQSIATFVGALTVIGGFLMTLYKYIIQKPLEKRRKEQEIVNQRKMQKAIMESLAPLNDTVGVLNESMEERSRHDKKLDKITEQNDKILKKHDERLDEHHERLVILEVKNGLRKNAHYVTSEEVDE